VYREHLEMSVWKEYKDSGALCNFCLFVYVLLNEMVDNDGSVGIRKEAVISCSHDQWCGKTLHKSRILTQKQPA
jgi:hypothetical protein